MLKTFLLLTISTIILSAASLVSLKYDTGIIPEKQCIDTYGYYKINYSRKLAYVPILNSITGAHERCHRKVIKTKTIFETHTTTQYVKGLLK